MSNKAREILARILTWDMKSAEELKDLIYLSNEHIDPEGTFDSIFPDGLPENFIPSAPFPTIEMKEGRVIAMDTSGFCLITSRRDGLITRHIDEFYTR